MGWVEPGSVPFGLTPQMADRQAAPAPVPSTDELMGAMWADNTVVSTFRHISESLNDVRDFPMVEGYDAFQDLAGYEQYAWRFADAESPGQVRAIKSRIDQELQNQQIIAASPFWDATAAGLITGLVDPINWLPAGRIIRGFTRAGTVAGGVMQGAKSAALAGVAREAILQETQLARPLEQGAADITAYAIFGGLAGGAMGLFRRTEAQVIQQAIKRDLGLAEPEAPNTLAEIAALDKNVTTASSAVDDLLRARPEVPVDTRGSGQIFHGTSTPVENLMDYYGSNLNYYGSGFYTTDAVDVARGYSKKGRGGRPTIHRVEEIPDQKLYDMEQPISDIDDVISRVAQHNDLVAQALEAEPKNLRELFDEIRDISGGEGIPASEVQEIFDGFVELLEDKGFVGFRHKGGLRTNTLEHDVRIYWKPEGSVRIAGDYQVFENYNAWHKQYQEALAELNDAKTRRANFVPTETAGGGSVSSGGAAAVETRTLNDLALKGSLGTINLVRNPIIGNNMAVVMTGESLAAKRVMADLASNPFGTIGETQGKASAPGGSVESNTPGWEGQAAKGTQTIREAWMKYRGLTSQQAQDAGLLRRTAIWARSRKDGKMTEQEFEEAVWDAAHSPEPTGVAEIDEGVAAYRKFFKTAFEEAKAVGRMGDDVEYDPLYSSRVYDQDEVYASRPEFVDRIVEKLERMRPEAGERLAEAQGKIDRLRTVAERLNEEIEALRAAGKDTAPVRNQQERIELQIEDIEERMDLFKGLRDGTPTRDLAHNAVDNIQGNFIGSVFAGQRRAGEAKGMFKARQLWFMTNPELRQWLNRSTTQTMFHYAKVGGPEIELTRKFGDPTMKDALQTVREDFNRKADLATTREEKSRIETQRDKTIRAIEVTRDIIRGVHQLPDNPYGIGYRTLRGIKEATLIAKGALFGLHSAPDVGRPLMIHGFERYFGDSIATLQKRLGSDPEFQRLLKTVSNDLRDMGANIELYNSGRVLALGEVWRDFGRTTKFEKGLHWAATQHGSPFISAMNHWNHYWRNVTGFIAMKRLLQVADNWEGAKVADREWAARMGITPELAIQISEQFARHGEKLDRVWNANWGEWTNGEARRAFQSAIVKDARDTIIQPGAASIPAWMHTPIGSLVGQFRSFTAESMNKVLIAGLQQRDAAALSGMIFSISIGMLNFAIDSLLAGRDPIKDYKPEDWIKEGIDRSGVMGWLFELNNLTGKLSGMQIENIYKGKEGTRYLARSGIESLLGPAFGTVSDLTDATRHIGLALRDDEAHITETDIHKIRKAAPWQNHLILRHLYDAVEDGIAAAVGAQERRQ